MRLYLWVQHVQCETTRNWETDLELRSGKASVRALTEHLSQNNREQRVAHRRCSY